MKRRIQNKLAKHLHEKRHSPRVVRRWAASFGEHSVYRRMFVSVFCSLSLLLVIGCGVPDSGVQPVKPIGSDAAHVIPAETKAYNAGLSILYETLAADVEAGKLKTVREAAEFAVAEDKRLRGEYKRAMGAMMEARLGDEELPADASKFFFEMSTAFGRLSK